MPSIDFITLYFAFAGQPYNGVLSGSLLVNNGKIASITTEGIEVSDVITTPQRSNQVNVEFSAPIHDMPEGYNKVQITASQNEAALFFSGNLGIAIVPLP